jgi:hypothetical protein
MKTAPTIGVAGSADAVVSHGLARADALAMSVIARRGLSAMSVIIGTALMTATFKGEIPEVHEPRPNTIRWGSVQPTWFAAKGQQQR